MNFKQIFSVGVICLSSLIASPVQAQQMQLGCGEDSFGYGHLGNSMLLHSGGRVDLGSYGNWRNNVGTWTRRGNDVHVHLNGRTTSFYGLLNQSCDFYY